MSVVGRTAKSLLVMALLVGLASDCRAQRRRHRRRPPGNGPASAEPFESAGPDIGDRAIDVPVHGVEGQEETLGVRWSERPLLLVLGSVTCPSFRERLQDLERIAGSYRGRVDVAILYTIEAHPSGSKSPYAEGEWVPPINERQGFTLAQPEDLPARLEAAKLAVRTLGIGVPVLVDDMDNTAWNAYGPAPNTAYLIDRHGFVVARQTWFDPDGMRRSIESLLAFDARNPAPPSHSPAKAADEEKGGS